MASALDPLRRFCDPPGADPACRTAQGVSEADNRLGRFAGNPSEQHAGLQIEQPQHIAFEFALAERHPRKVREIDDRIRRARAEARRPTRTAVDAAPVAP